MTMTHGAADEITRLRRLDLNLLVALDCLLVERGVSKAARRLGVSQSTASDALGRLRRHFGDPLLQGKPRAYELSPLAQRLRPAVAEAVTAADRVFAGMPDFEPSEDTVEYRFLGTDHTLIFAGAWLSRAITRQAARARVTMRTFHSTDDPEQLLRGHDGLILPHGMMRAPARHVDLGEDDLVLIMDELSSQVRSLADLALRPWVAASSPGQALSLGLEQLVNAGLSPRIVVDLPDYSSVPSYVEETDRLALLPRSLAERLAKGTRTRVEEPPMALERLRIALWWHPSRDGDYAHEWLRDVITRAADPAASY